MRDRDLRDQGMENNLEGTGDRLKGRIKDGVGGLTGDDSMQAEGKLDQLKGRVKDAVGDVQRKLGGDRDRV